MLNSNTESPYLIWNNRTRVELLEFLESQQESMIKTVRHFFKIVWMACWGIKFDSVRCICRLWLLLFPEWIHYFQIYCAIMYIDYFNMKKLCEKHLEFLNVFAQQNIWIGWTWSYVFCGCFYNDTHRYVNIQWNFHLIDTWILNATDWSVQTSWNNKKVPSKIIWKKHLNLY